MRQISDRLIGSLSCLCLLMTLFACSGGGGANNSAAPSLPMAPQPAGYSYAFVFPKTYFSPPPANAPVIFSGIDGNLYGYSDFPIQNSSGASSLHSIFFTLSPSGGLVNIIDFGDQGGSAFTKPNSIIAGNDGNFYGLETNQNGTTDFFSISPQGTRTVLNSTVQADKLTFQGSDGNLYGTYNLPDYANEVVTGSVIQLTLGGTVSSIYTFPYGRGIDTVLPGSDGNFYGLTSGNLLGGVVQDCGTIFRLTSGGVTSDLVQMPKGMNSCERSFFSQGSDAKFYGMYRDANGINTIYKMSLDGNVSVEFSFDASTTLGYFFEGSDGNFYGFTSTSNAPNGTMFEIKPSGMQIDLHDFGSTPYFDDNPVFLSMNMNGNLYGVTTTGGANGNGGLFQYIF